MKKILLLAVTVAAMMLLATGANQAGDKKKVTCKCPVSGKEAKETSAVDFGGGKVYFCCDMCPKEFAANKAKYTAKANQQLVCTKQATQVSCPFTGMQVNEDTIINVGGAKVGFCCQMCLGKAENVKGEAQVNLLFNAAAFKKGFEVKKK